MSISSQKSKFQWHNPVSRSYSSQGGLTAGLVIFIAIASALMDKSERDGGAITSGNACYGLEADIAGHPKWGRNRPTIRCHIPQVKHEFCKIISARVFLQ